MPYLTTEDKITLQKVANKIMYLYQNDIPLGLTENELVFIERLRMIYETDMNLILEDWQNSFENMDEDEAKYTLKVLFDKL